MSLKLAKNNVAPYDYYSESDGTDPAEVSVSLTNLGGTVNGNVSTHLVATEFRYSDIVLSFANEATGMDWKMSADGVNYYETLLVNEMDARTLGLTTPIYLRCVVANDGTVTTGLYTLPDLVIAAVESA